MDACRCFGCKKLLNIYDDETYPCKNSDDMNFYCMKCTVYYNLPKCIKIDDDVKYLFMKFNLKATCNCFNNIVVAGYAINRDTFEIECSNCRQQTSFNLQESSPLDLFMVKISNLKNHKFLPREQLQILNKLNISEYEEIYKKIQVAESYILETPRCLTHFKNTFYIGENSFKYICELCNTSENKIYQYDHQNFNNLCRKLFENIKNMNTRFFTTCIIDYLKNPNPTYFGFKNLIYDYGQICSESKDPKIYLTPDSMCLNCKEIFSFKNLPISTHGELKHEICSNCFFFNNIKTCPVDGEKISMPQKFDPNFLVSKLEKKCCIADCKYKFSIILNIIPFETTCLHNICSNCLQNPIKKFSKCYKYINSHDCKVNETLKDKIIFSEIICKQHNQVAENFYYVDSLIKPICSKDNKRANPIEVEQVITTINETLYNIINNKHIKDELDTFILSNYQFIPLSIKSNYIENLRTNNESNKIASFRFNNLLPKYNTSKLYWYDKGSLNTFSFTSQIIGAIVGVIIGRNIQLENPYNIDFNLINENNQICIGNPVIIPNENRFLYYLFNQRIPIGLTRTFFKVRLGPGAYYQGEGELEADHNSFGFNGKDCFLVQFTSSKGGNMNCGGPLLGFLIEDIYVPTQFLPDNIRVTPR